MKHINRHGKESELGMTEDRKKILEKVVEKLLKENKVIFERLDEI